MLAEFPLLSVPSSSWI